MIKVSIIVPVFNCEQYLKKCFDSISQQTLKEFECLVIDDGSIDSSGAICESYATKDIRFKVFHQKNKGVSAARNLGISLAKGEYIGFVDSDDWIEPGMYEFLYKNAKNNNVDISICGCFPFNSGKNRYKFSFSEAICKMFFNDYSFSGYCWTRLIKQKCLENVRFNENLKCYEDIVFFYNLFKKVQSVYWYDKPYYHYEARVNSAINSYLVNQNKIDGINVISDLAKAEKNVVIKEAIHGFLYRWYLETAINYVSHKNTNCNEFLICKEKIKKREYLTSCTFRQRLWRYIILSDPLKKTYWFIKDSINVKKR